MEYMSAQDAAARWGITKRRVQLLCATGRIEGATRLGNMWLLPLSAEKPQDKRKKGETKRSPSVRTARSAIKSVTSKSMLLLLGQGMSHDEAKTAIVSAFATELFSRFCREEAARAVEAVTNYSADKPELGKIRGAMKRLIEEFPHDCDDALSWCYQYANKVRSPSPYRDTQFFTEKFMISALVDEIDVPTRNKIFDPACGGGNFLLRCLEALSAALQKSSDKEGLKDGIQRCLSKLYGYEIDPVLAVVASLSLRLKGAELLHTRGYSVTADDFLFFSPNIFFPLENTILGALDLPSGKTNKVASDRTGEDLLEGVDAIVTNPPFRTVKGMPDELKQALKEKFPLSKCDMCNAFLEWSGRVLKEGGAAGFVTQNSWMYLDSFVDLRRTLLSSRTLERVWELGSNAFYDLNGEKANVALVVFRNTPPREENNIVFTALSSLPRPELEAALSSRAQSGPYTKVIPQISLLHREGVPFHSTEGSSRLLSSERYGQYAVPMQGTSTGNAKELIDFFWKHIGDPSWRSVSKGGGYARWQGLNHYCVKWGQDGEYIRAQAGSALRNVNRFSETQMVFSDTGTSGLNVRKLHQGQIFVASGPGIRILSGKMCAHLAFLNSRPSSYFARLLSPKLTIAAGYIAKLPVCGVLLFSDLLEEYGRRCVELKLRRLERRPYHAEFRALQHCENADLPRLAREWLLADLGDEWEQLCLEEKIDDAVCAQMGISSSERRDMEKLIGTKRVTGKDTGPIPADLALEAERALDVNGEIVRTKTDKTNLGCDGLLEYLSQKTGLSCETVFRFLTTTCPEGLVRRYYDLLLHAILMSLLGYSRPEETELFSLLSGFSKENVEELSKWVFSSFNAIHPKAFRNAPVYRFDPKNALFLTEGT